MKYSLDDTIAAISTPQGIGGIGIIRLSGIKSIEIAENIFKSTFHKTLLDLPTHTIHHGWIKINNEVVDEVMVTILKKPHSFTGEDTIEISAHGGPVVLGKILALCIENGARHAEKGEFTFRAFIKGKMDLAKAESVAELICSKTESAAQASVNQLKGILSKKVEAWRKKLVEILSKVEAALDHTEENIQFIKKNELKNTLSLLLEEVADILRTADKGKLLRDGLKISIIGKPNSGKSSLLNAILERERAIVTDIPGTTRDVLEESLELRGIPLVIVDTAGIRSHTQDIVEKIGQEKTKEAALSSDIILFILDSSVSLSDEDKQIVDLLIDNSLIEKTILVWNKTDLPAKINNDEISKLLPKTLQSIKISAVKRIGLDSLEDAIISFVNFEKEQKNAPLLITLRHTNVLERASKDLKEALDASQKKESEEFIAFHIRNSLNILGEITGETVTDEILDNIFSKFCIGK